MYLHGASVAFGGGLGVWCSDNYKFRVRDQRPTPLIIMQILQATSGLLNGSLCALGQTNILSASGQNWSLQCLHLSKEVDTGSGSRALL